MSFVVMNNYPSVVYYWFNKSARRSLRYKNMEEHELKAKYKSEKS